jgi:branched-chain amino acid transport system permease protein
MVLFASKARSRTGLPTLVMLIALAAIPGFGVSEQLLATLTLALIYATAVVGLDVYSGYGGLLSFGNFAFVAIGAYTSAILSSTYGWDYWATLPVTIVVCAVCSTILGFAIVRIPDLGAAFMTFFFGFVVVIMIEGSSFGTLTHGENGISVPPLSLGSTSLTVGTGLYYLALVLLALPALIGVRYVNSRAGRVLRVVKRSDVVAASLAVRVSSARLSAFVYSAICAGVAGFVFAQSLGYLAPESFDYSQSIELVIMLVVGGIGSIGGGIAGAVVLELIAEWAQSAGQLSQVLDALLLLIVVVGMPEGLYGIIERLARHVPAPLRKRLARIAHPWAWRLQAGAARREMPGESPASKFSASAAAVVAGAPRPAQLHVRDLTVAFGGVHALSRVTLDVARSELLGVIGPNGAGKTTLLNCISGIQPHQGTIRLEDTVISGQSPRVIRRAGVARTFQNPSLVPDLSILENVELGAYWLSPSSPLRDLIPSPHVLRRDRRAREMASHTLDVIGFPMSSRRRMAGEVSLAEQKLTDLARAIVGRPALLMLDEPTAGLDEEDMASLKETLLRVSRETSTTMVVISHHIGFLRLIADRVIVLDFGKVLAVGTPEEVLERDDVVEAFVGPAQEC